MINTAWSSAIPSGAECSEVALVLPAQLYRLEEVNLPPALAASLVGQAVTVQVAPEEKAFTRRIDPKVETSGWRNPNGEYWNDYQPVRILFADPQGRVWRFPRRWLTPAISESPLDPLYAVTGEAVWTERIHMPTEWDIQDINIDMIAAMQAKGKVAIVEVRAIAGQPVKVLWRDNSGNVWRLPHDWRRRRIKLPSYDVLVLRDIVPEVAKEYAGRAVSVNYHPGSLCCLPDGYRFRDGDGSRWEVKMQDCVLLGYGDEAEHQA